MYNLDLYVKITKVPVFTLLYNSKFYEMSEKNVFYFLIIYEAHTVTYIFSLVCNAWYYWLIWWMKKTELLPNRLITINIYSKALIPVLVAYKHFLKFLLYPFTALDLTLLTICYMYLYYLWIQWIQRLKFCLVCYVHIVNKGHTGWF